MNKYNIFKNAEGELEVVKKGWSWPGFLFTWIWAFVKRLNGLGVGLLFAFLILNLVSRVMVGYEMLNYVLLIIGVSLAIWIGVDGNRMRRRNLRKRGFKKTQTVSAYNLNAALKLVRSGLDNDSSNCTHDKLLGDTCINCGARILSSQYSGKHNNAPPLDKDARRYGNVLGLRGKITIEDIKLAYKQNILKYHPDKVSHLGSEFQEIAERKTKEINEAYRYFRNKYNF